MSDVTSDPTDIRAHERAAADKATQQAAASAQSVEDFKWLMAHRQGRRIVWSLLAEAGVFRTSFTGNSETFFREGKRQIGLLLLAQIHEICPEQYAVMLKEQGK